MKVGRDRRPTTSHFRSPSFFFFFFYSLLPSALLILSLSLSLSWLTQLSSLSSSREGRCCFIALSLASPERIAGASFPSLPLVAVREGRVLPRLYSCFPTQPTYPPTHIIAPITQVFEEPSSYSLADTPLGESWRGNAFGQF